MVGDPKKTPSPHGGVIHLNLLTDDRASDRLDVSGGRPFGALLQIELYLLAFAQGLEALTLDSGVMHEDIFAAIRRRDEAEALGVVEPLYGSCNHK